MSNIILGNEFICRVAPMIGMEPNRIRRIIIDAKYDGLVTVYVELLGDKRLMEINVEMLAGVTVVTEQNSEAAL